MPGSMEDDGRKCDLELSLDLEGFKFSRKRYMHRTTYFCNILSYKKQLSVMRAESRERSNTLT